MNSTMSPYLMRKTSTRNKRRVSRLEDPVPTNVHNFNNNNMMVPNVAHVIRRGQAGNNAPTGNEYRPRASLERKRR